MNDTYLLLTPILTLLVVALVGFVGCDAVFGLDEVRPGPPPVNNFKAVPGNMKVDLSWDSYNGANAFQIKRGTVSGDHPDVHTIMDGMATTYTDPDRINGVTYYYVIAATVGSGETEPSEEQTAVPGVYGVVTSFIASKMPGTLRNFSGWMGMGFVVGSKPLNILKLGRAFAPGNTRTHAIKLVDAITKLDVPNGSSMLAVNSGTAGEFVYTDLANPVTLAAGAAYYLVSEEMMTGDQFYDADTTVTTTNAAVREFAVYGDGAGIYTEAPVDGHAYGPLDFQYTDS